MRRTALLAGLMGTGAVVPLLAGAVPADAGPPVVEYRGLRIPVPAGWEVHRLDRDPNRCVRFDRRALYLGTPGDQPDCPAKLVGRTEALHVEPLGEPSAQRRAAVRADKLARHTVSPSVGGDVRLGVPEAGVAINGAYGDSTAPLQNVIRSIRLTSAWAPEPPSALRRATPVVPARHTAVERKWARGKAFDTCTAPSLGAMAAWRRAYGIANIYIGGAARGCAQPNLTRYWVQQTRRMGYRLIPTYVGLQAPCTEFKRQRFTARNAAAKGAEAARDAAYRARALGIPRKRPIYFDMEAYNSRDASCRNAVLRFMDAWTRTLRETHRYAPGVYSSVDSGIRDLGWATGIAKPRAIWYARWDRKAQVYSDPTLLPHWWPPHRRIKQYRGGHRERHGGVTINVDSNVVDGRVY